MITADFVRMMSRYNTWQNRNLYDAADGLSEESRQQDRGAFFGGIHRTLSHLLWADHVWMSRFDRWEPPRVKLAESPGWIDDWSELRSKRRISDARIARWAAALSDEALEGDLAWTSGAEGRDVVRPRAMVVQHFFNHQTHHRGQVHAMLTAAGARPGPTDLFLMPDA